MANTNNGGRVDLPVNLEGARYSLDRYRDDRVEANVRRVTMERAAPGLGNLAIDPTSPSAARPRRRAVLRETSMRNNFEYVNYNLPETTAQEVVHGRQVGRDMADPGIRSSGHRVADIVHLPPRHARLSPPVAVQRSSRNALLARDRAMEVDANVKPLPRPYVPRGLVDDSAEPFQHGRQRDQQREMYYQIRRQGAGIRQAGRNLQNNLGTTTVNPNTGSMELEHVQLARDVLRDANPDFIFGRYQILATLQDLQENFYPNEVILSTTGIFHHVRRLRDNANEEVAQLATDLVAEWRATLRAAAGRSLHVEGEDPFVDEGAEEYGQGIPREHWDNTLRDRQLAARDFNNAVGEETRAAAVRRRRDLELQREDQAQENVRRHREHLRDIKKATASANGGDGDENAREPESTITDPVTGRNRNPDSTITDPSAGGSLTNGQEFNILEVDPSPERPEGNAGNGILRQRSEDMAVETIEVEAPAGLCHECPIFRNTYHHVRVGNSPCNNLRARTRPIRQQKSPEYAPSQSPRPTAQTADERARDANEAMARLEQTANSIRPIVDPANIPSGMADPFTTTGIRRRHGIPRFSQQRSQLPLGEGTEEASPGKGHLPQFQCETTPIVATFPSSQRPTYAQYNAASPTQLLAELKGRQTVPDSSGAGIDKDTLIRIQMGHDFRGTTGNGAHAPRLSEHGQGGNSVSPLNLDFSEYTGVSQTPLGAARSGSAGTRAGSKRSSPARSEGQPAKRLRGSNGRGRTA